MVRLFHAETEFLIREELNQRRVSTLPVYIISTLMILSVILFYPVPVQADSMQTSDDISAASDQTGSVQPDQVGVLTPDALIRELNENHVPSMYAYLPNVLSAGEQTTPAPFYLSSPAPMGIMDYGVMSPTGSIQKYQYDTSTFNGSIMLEGLQVLSLSTVSAGSVSVQLNAVLNHTTIHGNSNNVFWVHNVALYDPSNGTVQLVDNIWDVSSPEFSFPADYILQGNGITVPGLLYYYAGPVIKVSSSFTLYLQVTAGLYGNEDAIYFGYSLAANETTFIESGQYDTVVFNSGRNSAPQAGDVAMFHVDGMKTTPSGLLYDVEFVLGGPGSGSTASIMNAEGLMRLYLMNSATSSYSLTPSAINSGSNTAETISGLSVWWSSVKKPMAHISTGPSLLVKLWGATETVCGAIALQGTIEPPNSFMFINIGTTFNASSAAWAPISPNGSYRFALPGFLQYSGAVMLSDYSIYTFSPADYTKNSTGGGASAMALVQAFEEEEGGGKGMGQQIQDYLNVSLPINTGMGVYTPLYANGNDHLKYLTVGSSKSGSYTGNGSQSNPFVIENSPFSGISSLFTRVNPFLYPEFYGLQIMNTYASVLLQDPPAYTVEYTQVGINPYPGGVLPTHNTLGYMFYNTSGITLSGARGVSGWFPSTMTGMPAANAVFMESKDFLVANSTFSVMGSSLLIYNSQGELGSGTVWGNHFVLNDSVNHYSEVLLNGDMPTALSVFSSGNLIYNNYFDSPRSAYSPRFDLITRSTNVTYENSWNLPEKKNLSYVNTVHGYNLSGAIVNVNYQGGNYWYNFDGSIPYNDSGNIAYGGDLYPLILPVYTVTFNAIGLPADQTWGVTMHGKSTMSHGGEAVSFLAPNGTYSYTISKPSIYSFEATSTEVTVAGEAVVIDLVFSLIQFDVKFIETGLPSGSEWSVVLNGVVLNSTTDTVTFLKENGTWSYSVLGPANYSTPAPGVVIVDGTSVSQAVSFVYILYQVIFRESGLPEGESWILTVDGMQYITPTNSVTVDLPNGTHDYAVSTSWDGYAIPSSGQLSIAGESTSINISFVENTYIVGFHALGLASGTLWEVNFNGLTYNSTTSWIYFSVPNGNYTYSIMNVTGFTANNTTGFVVVDHAGATINVTFAEVTAVAVGSFPTSLVIALGSAAVVTALLVSFILLRKRGM